MKNSKNLQLCGRLLRLNANSVSSKRKACLLGRSWKPNFPTALGQACSKKSFGSLSVLHIAVRSSSAFLFQTCHLVYLFSGTASTGCILLPGTVSGRTDLLCSLNETFLCSWVTFLQAAAFSMHSILKLNITDSGCSIYKQLIIVWHIGCCVAY